MAFLKQRLRPALYHGGAKELWLAVRRLLNLLEDYEACSIVWAQQGITDWKECRSIRFRDMHYMFADTDVPIATLFQHFAQGQGIAEFLARYPSVAKDQVEDVLEHAVLTLYS